jgi:aconitate hydratase
MGFHGRGSLPPDLIQSFVGDDGAEGCYYHLGVLERDGWGRVSRLPVCLRVLLESLVRNCDGSRVTVDQVHDLAGWQPRAPRTSEIPFIVSRVLLQDLSGLPVLNDLAAMRATALRAGLDPCVCEPTVPVDLVVDHAVSVDVHGRPDALRQNLRAEYAKNSERLRLLKWAQCAFQRLRVVPPGQGIVHQVNLERLARVVEHRGVEYFPDTMVGTDSHMTMVNGLGVLGWGVGGLEATAALLGEPIPLLMPDVVGVHLTGRLRDNVNATDLVLTLTQRLRKAGVVGKFIEYFGPGAGTLAVADRATVANMAPDYGATCGYFPVDERTLDYLRATGRTAQHVLTIERYMRLQGLFGMPEAGVCDYSDVIELDLESIEASVAGPNKPEQRMPLSAIGRGFDAFLRDCGETGPAGSAMVESPRRSLHHGDVLIAAITSCTNTSNPKLMLAAGLLAQKAVAAGLKVPSHVKTSLAPGSRAVSEYLTSTALLPALETLGFHVVAHGCTTCMGNSGPLLPGQAEEIARSRLITCAVLSGNRNFDARIHEALRANYLMSPALVVAFALAGTVRIDLEREPVGTDLAGRKIYLRDIWPTEAEIDALMPQAADPEIFRRAYSAALDDEGLWDAIEGGEGQTFAWPDASTYLVEPPFCEPMGDPAARNADILGARALMILGDGVTTDHITPNGTIRPDSPAGGWLINRGVPADKLNTYAMRRCNHEVMVRGAFDNPRLSNALAAGTLGAVTHHQPSGELLAVYDAAMRYRDDKVPIVIFAGREYGTGSSRDWAARAPALLGVRAVIAESFERIHRSNLVGMGILPCEFAEGTRLADLALDGTERIDLTGPASGMRPRASVTLVVHPTQGPPRRHALRLRVDTEAEAAYVRAGGLLPHAMGRLTNRTHDEY